VRRQISNTPLQALELLNDPQFVEAYRTLAAHAIATSPQTDAQLAHLFRLATRRQPLANELTILQTFYQGELARYNADRPGAESFLKTGVTPLPANADLPRLAALTSVTALVMNSPDAYSIR
jgi:hypothetical protein